MTTAKGSLNLAPATTWKCPVCSVANILLRHESQHRCTACGSIFETALLIIEGWCR